MKQVKFRVSGHFLENSWREWPEILHADVSWPPSQLISSGSQSVDFLILGLFWLSETGQISGFRAFPGERMEGMACNMVCCCILATFRTDWIMDTVRWFVLFWCYFDLVKWVKFGVSRHFLENLLRKWPEILHADLSWLLSELIRLWLQFIDFANFDAILT